MNPKWLAWGGAAAVAISAIVAASLYARSREDSGLRARMAAIVPVGGAQQQPCQALAARRPFVILALGQSNAGNHGSVESRSAQQVTMITQGKCITTQDPLPGATGSGGSIWSRLVAHLSNPLRDGGSRGPPIVLAVLAVDSSSMEEWTHANGALRSRLTDDLALMKRAQLPPDLVLWQQGEADAMKGRSTDQYAAGLDALAQLLTSSGISAPVMLAHSTRCRSAPSQAIRAAIDLKAAAGGRWLTGPDTDALSAAEFRHDGCHFSAAGLDAAAQLWAKAITHAQGQLVRR